MWRQGLTPHQAGQLAMAEKKAKQKGKGKKKNSTQQKSEARAAGFSEHFSDQDAQAYTDAKSKKSTY